MILVLWGGADGYARRTTEWKGTCIPERQNNALEVPNETRHDTYFSLVDQVCWSFLSVGLWQTKQRVEYFEETGSSTFTRHGFADRCFRLSYFSNIALFFSNSEERTLH